MFGLNLDPLPAAALAEQIQRLAPGLRCAFQGDDRGWFRVELAADQASAELDQYWATEPGIRAQLNTWAAWLEVHEDNPSARPLMQRIIQTGQLFCLQAPPALAGVCLDLTRWLAAQTDGVYQVDGSGFHAADGTLLVAEAT